MINSTIHLFEFARRAPSLQLPEFAARWRDFHGERIAGDPSVLQASVLTRMDGGGPGEIDGAVELWFASPEEHERYRARRAADSRARAGLADLLAEPPGPPLVTRDRAILHRGPLAAGDGLVKLLYVLKRAAGLSLEHFSRYYEHVHTLYSTRPPFQRNYVQAHRLPGAAGGESGFDGVSCIWFEDRLDMEGYLASEELEDGVADCRRFLDLASFFSLAGVEQRLRWLPEPARAPGRAESPR